MNSEPDVCADRNIESRYAWLLALMNLLRDAPFEEKTQQQAAVTTRWTAAPSSTFLALPNKQGA